MNTAIRVRHVSKSFVSQSAGHKTIKALDDVSLDVRKGEILGVLGPNGAGKTTFLNILSTLLLPDAGEIEILGIRSTPRNINRLRRLLNMSSGYPNYPWSLTVEENLKFYGWLYGLRGRDLARKIGALAEVFELGDFLKTRFDELSSGTKQKLSLAKALINDPKIIFLDEPTVGLDPDVAVRTRELVLRIIRESGVTVILTTHYMHEAEQMCHRIAFIRKGRLLRLASPEELKSAHRKDDLEQVFIELAHSPAEATAGAALPVLLPAGAGDDGPRDNAWACASGWVLRCLAFAYRNFLIAIRNIFAYVELIFWPVVSLVSIGLLGNYLELGDKALAFILTGAIAGGIL
ncbi:MAG: ABC transporter ATP-binding protein [Candidatus Omnitrophota bacterium]|nr:ABC transporter ATP-binding protein [Candidatus Omnitrophota bacterium]MDZ4242063.1 ABC transporter ATP-binding protein [Candidatus Omnitrophota bacterium]